MRIPKYIQEIMERSNFALGYGDPGYTLEIRKDRPYTRIETLENEILKLEKWVTRNMPKDDLGIPTMIINSIPKRTHYSYQYAIVTIYDPIMKYLEEYIKKDVR